MVEQVTISRTARLTAFSITLAVIPTAADGVGAYESRREHGRYSTAQPKGERTQDPLVSERTKGDPNAPVAIYEITDFACSWCREFYELVLPTIEQEYIRTGKAKLIFVNLPIPQLHPNSPAAHEFAMCAAKQDRFWPVHDLLYNNQSLWSALDSPRDYFTVLADSAGLNLDSLNICFDTGSVRWIVQREAEAVAQQASITRAPSFVIESVVLAGYQPIEIWRPILDSLYTEITGRDR